MKHKLCNGCRWEAYPVCNGTIEDGIKMNIENLPEDFICGRKDLTQAYIGDSMNLSKSPFELMIKELETRIEELEKR
jgi:hypothetical protein